MFLETSSVSKATQVLKAAGLDNLFGRFLKDGAKFLSKPNSDLCILSITCKKFCNSHKLEPLYIKSSLTQLCNYILIFCDPNI